MMSFSKELFRFFAVGFAALIIFVSIVAGAHAYEAVDPDDYRLLISDVTITSHEQISFDVYNQGLNDFSYLDLHSYEVDFEGSSALKRFSHSLGEPLSVLGTLQRGDGQLFKLPVDVSSKGLGDDLFCGEPMSIELFNEKGKTLGKWTGIPICLVEAPRPVGLMKVNNRKADYYDGSLEIVWEVLDADRDSESVLLSRSAGSLDTVVDWYSAGDCPDVEAGKCMTSLSFYFSYDTVWVTLEDFREQTSVTLERPLWDVSLEEFVVERSGSTTVADTTETFADLGGSGDVDSVDITKADSSSQVRECLDGCPADNDCFLTGDRRDVGEFKVYCEGNVWLVQKRDGSSCASDYECEIDACNAGICSSERVEVKKEPWITRLLLWIDNLI